MAETLPLFEERARKALENARLQKSLTQMAQRFAGARLQAMAQFPDWERYRQLAHDIKKHTLDHLGDYLEELERRVTDRGGRVLWAKDARAACDFVLRIARERRIKTAVKSKSMTAEEIALNEALEKGGVEAVETDLGEFIVQLAGERPSHIIAPAVHKSREEVAELFVRKLRSEHYNEIEQLAGVARKTLRQKFLQAGMGISGVNFAVAETGTIVIFENEGNARFCTAAPRLHVALMGIEKVIPRMNDLLVFLALLGRAATGQKLPSYVSFLTGPRRPGEKDGPEEFFLILLDNGRSRILRDPLRRESLYCIRCGACLNVCPVYQKIGGHAYGWVYSGPIGAVLSPQYQGMREAGELPYASSLCGACEDACPVKIPLPRLLLDLRREAIETGGQKEGKPVDAAERRAMRWWLRVNRSARSYRFFTAIARRVGRWKATGEYISSLSGALAGWTKERDFPAPAASPFRQRWAKLKKQKEAGPSS